MMGLKVKVTPITARSGMSLSWMHDLDRLRGEIIERDGEMSDI